VNDLDEDLLELGAQWRAAQPPLHIDVASCTSLTRRRRPTRLVVTAITATVLAATAVVIATTRHNTHRVVVVERPTPSGTAPAVIKVGVEISQVQALALAGGRIWVTGNSPDGGSAALDEYSLETGQRVATVRLSDDWPFAAAAGTTSVWVRSQQNEESTHLYAIDRSTRRITISKTLHVDGGLAVTSDAVWVIDPGIGLLQLDPTTGATVRTIPLPDDRYGPSQVTAGPLGVWLASPYNGSVLRLDQTTNEVHPVVDVGASAGQLVELDQSVWVAADDALFEIPINDPTHTRRVNIGHRILDLVTNGRDLYIADDGLKPVLRVDPSTLTVSTVALPTTPKPIVLLAADPASSEIWGATTLGAPARLIRVVP
jgi:hypothetical protein